MNASIRSSLSCWVDAGERVAAVSVVEIHGSSPHSAGLSMLVNSSGEVAGAVSGGCVDGALVEACDDVLRSKRSRVMAFDADQGEFGEIGLICGGTLRVWIYEIDETTARTLSGSSGEFAMSLRGHPESGPTTIAIEIGRKPSNQKKSTLSQLTAAEWEFREHFGQRDLVLIIGQSGFTNSIASLGRLLGHEVVACDPRPRFAAAVTEADRVVVDKPDQCIENLARQGRLDANSAVIICTHDRKFDLPALLAAVRTGAGFIGAMGSRLTVAGRRKRLIASGVSSDDLARIHSPLGLDLGAETPSETAVSIFAQWIAHRHGRNGAALHQTDGNIHARP